MSPIKVIAATFSADTERVQRFEQEARAAAALNHPRRVGLEWTNYARLAPWMTVDADLAFTNARFTDDDPAGAQIPGALDHVISAGVTIEPREPAFASLRVRHFGPRPLIEDGSVESKSTTIWNGEVGYRVSNKARLVFEAFNIFDAKVSDIDYFYASRLPDEPVDGVEDIHTHRLFRDLPASESSSRSERLNQPLRPASCEFRP